MTNKAQSDLFFSDICSGLSLVKIKKFSKPLTTLKNSFSYLLIYTVFFNCTTTAQAQETATVKEIQIESKILDQKRPLHIYTPWLYDERDLVSFDVVYVFDAQHRQTFDLVHSILSYVFFKKDFIVVGIASPAYPETDYYRNSDYLPEPTNVSLEKYQSPKPNAHNFRRYVMEEVMPYVNANYRTTGINYTLGHSLSASFVLDLALHHHDLFDGFLSVSPNLAYDDFRLANDFLKMDFKKPARDKFIYISQADEPQTWAKPWGDAYRKVKRFVETTKDKGKYQLFIRDFPKQDHQSTMPPSVFEGITLLKNFIDQHPYTLNGEKQEVTFRVKVLEPDDEAYIAGNQESLGLWDASKVKLNKVSELERAITLQVQFPLVFKITKGTWQHEAFTDQTTNNGENIVVFKAKDQTIRLQVNEWTE